MDWKESFNALSVYIADLEGRLRKARLMYTEWQLNEKRMTAELLHQGDSIHALVEILSEHISRVEIDKILANAGGEEKE